MAKKKLSMGVKTALTAGTVGVVLMLLRKRAYAAEPSALPTGSGPAGTLNTQALLGQMVGGSRSGARYEIVGVGIFGQQQGMFRASAKPPVGSILLEVAAYPADPSAEGRQFRLEKTIDRWGATHPTVAAVQQLLDSAWESAALTAVGASINPWHNVNPAAIQALQARGSGPAPHIPTYRRAPTGRRSLYLKLSPQAAANPARTRELLRQRGILVNTVAGNIATAFIPPHITNAMVVGMPEVTHIEVPGGVRRPRRTPYVPRRSHYDPVDREQADAALDQMEQEYTPLALDDYEDAGWSFGADYE